MNAEIIAVGSEMLTPERIDTNSLYLTAELNNIGVEVVAKSVIGDDRDRLAEAVRLAMSRSPILILSGGLGPTEDDVTREAVALALGRGLAFSDEIAEALERRFAQAGRKMAEVNRRQALVIEGASVLPNDRGTAPGQWVEESGAVAMLLPGPPHELKAMFERQCLPRLKQIVPKLAIRTLFLRVAGMSESDLDQLIAPVYAKYENPATTILAAAGDIQIHLRARCATEAEADALLAEVGGPIELLLGDRLYSRNGEPLEAVVGGLLRQRRATVSVAESCTGGMLGERFTSVAGSSDYFLGGFIAYHNAMKIEMLGVPPETLENVRRGEPGNRRGHGHRRARTHRIHIRAFGHGPGRTRRGPRAGRRVDPRGHGLRGCRRCRRRPRSASRVPGRSPAHSHVHRPNGARSAAAADAEAGVSTPGNANPGGGVHISHRCSGVMTWRGHSCPMSLSFPGPANPADMVGRTPWSARVPLDPLFSRRIKRLPSSTSRPGGRLRTRGSAPPFVQAPDNGRTKWHWARLPGRPLGPSALMPTLGYDTLSRPRTRVEKRSGTNPAAKGLFYDVPHDGAAFRPSRHFLKAGFQKGRQRAGPRKRIGKRALLRRHRVAFDYGSTLLLDEIHRGLQKFHAYAPPPIGFGDEEAAYGPDRLIVERP